MVEYLTEAIVLDKRPDKNLDVVLTIFSRDLGKVYGKATSSRKITSRLASHLEPGTLAKVRLARRGVGDNFRIIEALTEARRADPETARFLMFLDKMAPIAAKDEVLFMFCREVVKDPAFSEKMAYRGLLKIIGLDPDKATCARCGRGKIAYFSSQDIMFLCRQCGRTKYGY